MDGGWIMGGWWMMGGWWVDGLRTDVRLWFLFLYLESTDAGVPC